MGLFRKKEVLSDNIIACDMLFEDGLSMFYKGEVVSFKLFKDEQKIAIQSLVYKNMNEEDRKSAYLNFDKIDKIEIVNEKDIIEKQKSVGGRAVMGGLLLGPLGAVVGGMSGIGSKKKTNYKDYVIINHNEDKAISLRVMDFKFKYIDIVHEFKKSKPEGIRINKNEIEL